MPFDITNRLNEGWTTISNNNIMPKHLDVSVSMEFYGNELWLIGDSKKADSKILMKIDDLEPKEIKFVDKHSNTQFYTKLPIGNHKLVITVKSLDVELHGIFYCIGHRYIPKEKLIQDNIKNSQNSFKNIAYRFNGNLIWIIGKSNSRNSDMAIYLDGKEFFVSPRFSHGKNHLISSH